MLHTVRICTQNTYDIRFSYVLVHPIIGFNAMIKSNRNIFFQTLRY